MSFQESISRSEKLITLSQMVINNQITYKLDFIASVYINGSHYFNVFRRYNSPYNIIIEDMRGEFYYHKNNTVRLSLQLILCITKSASDNIYTESVISYKHTSPVSSVSNDIVNMRWCEVATAYGAISVNLKGILNDFHSISETLQGTQVFETKPIINEVVDKADNMDIIQAGRTLLGLKKSEIDVKIGKRVRGHSNACYCYDADTESESIEDDEIEIKPEYTILRNGTKVPKRPKGL